MTEVRALPCGWRARFRTRRAGLRAPAIAYAYSVSRNSLPAQRIAPHGVGPGTRLRTKRAVKAFGNVFRSCQYVAAEPIGGRGMATGAVSSGAPTRAIEGCRLFVNPSPSNSEASRPALKRMVCSLDAGDLAQDTRQVRMALSIDARQPHSSFEASWAPSASTRSFAHASDG